MKKLVYLIGIFLIAGLAACTSGKKALERGDYDAAVRKAVERLRKNPDNKKARSTLKDGYRLAVRWYEQKADNLLKSNDPFKWRGIVDSYSRINFIYEQINRSPGALRVIPNPKNYYNEIEEARENAAEESYNAGLARMELNTREDARAAYIHFLEADGFVAGYKEVEDKIAEAKYNATLKVVVQQIPVPQRYALSGGFFQAKVEEFLNSQLSGNEFVRFYNPEEAEIEGLEQPDQYMVLAFDDFTVGETHLTESSREYSRDSVKVGEVTLDDGTVIPAYNTVKATLTVFRKEVISNGLLSMEVVDARNNAIITSEKFPGEFVWFSEWGSFNGDERALTREQIAITGQREVLPPPHQDLFIEFTKPIYDQVVGKIRYFYSRY